MDNPKSPGCPLSSSESNVENLERVKAKKPAKSLVNPILLKPVDKSDGILQVILETPKGSRNKFAFAEKQKIFTRIAAPPAH